MHPLLASHIRGRLKEAYFCFLYIADARLPLAEKCPDHVHRFSDAERHLYIRAVELEI